MITRSAHRAASISLNTYNTSMRKMNNFFWQEGLTQVYPSHQVSALVNPQGSLSTQLHLEKSLMLQPRALGYWAPDMRSTPTINFAIHGNIHVLRSLLSRLCDHFEFPKATERRADISYTHQGYAIVKQDRARELCGTENLTEEHEQQLTDEFGPVVLLEHFQDATWNVRRFSGGKFAQVNLLIGEERCAVSSELETNKERMRHRFYKHSDRLRDLYGYDRLQHDLDDYLSLPMVKRIGGAIDIISLVRALSNQ